MERGEYVSPHVPYGYRLVDKKVVVYEPEAEIVRRIFRLYLQGMGIQQISDLLESEGLKRPRRNGKKCWGKSTISYILRNERYMGDAVLQKKYTTDCLPYRQKRNKGEKKQYYVENYCPAIISSETFNAVQKLMAEKREKESTVRNYILSKKMRCPDCGRTFRKQITKEKAYWCCSQWATVSGKCKSRRIREDMAYEAFTAMVYKLKVYRKVIIEDLIKRLEYLQDRTSENIERIRAIDKEIADLSAQNLVVTRLHTGGVIDAAEYSKQTAQIGNKIMALRTERRKKLNESESDVKLDDLKNLNEIIEECRVKAEFDETLFEGIVEKIIVEDSSKITFQLIGGLTLTEGIKEKGRCKTA